MRPLPVGYLRSSFLESYNVFLSPREPAALPLRYSMSRGSPSPDDAKEFRPSLYNGMPEGNPAPQLPSRRKVSNSSDPYLRRLDTSSYIIEADMEENSLI